MITFTWAVLLLLAVTGISVCMIVNKIANMLDRLEDILEDCSISVEAVRED